MFLERFNPTVVEERRVATKQFLNFAIQQMYLRTHDSYMNFFQVINNLHHSFLCINNL
jgi:hypothetical protein